MKRIAIALLFAAVAGLAAVCGAVNPPVRPKILGISHMALYVTDLQKSRWFYENFLGFAEPYNLKRDDGSVRIAFIKINDDQSIELFTDPPKQDGQLNHIAFQTDDAEAMRQYLAAQGIKVPPAANKGKIGNSEFTVTDPDGHGVEFVQYEPDGWTRLQKGTFLPDTRISVHMPHVGVTIRALDVSTKYYGDILGFKEFWRGSQNGKILSWANLRVPDGEDYLEMMLYSGTLDAKTIGTKNHICLVVPDIDKAVATLKSRPDSANYTQPIQIKVGVNGKRQANLYDPDGTRVELMEPNTFNHQPVPPSAAPPPQTTAPPNT